MINTTYKIIKIDDQGIESEITELEYKTDLIGKMHNQIIHGTQTIYPWHLSGKGGVIPYTPPAKPKPLIHNCDFCNTELRSDAQETCKCGAEYHYDDDDDDIRNEHIIFLIRKYLPDVGFVQWNMIDKDTLIRMNYQEAEYTILIHCFHTT